ncbi:endonuclease [Geodermatophilus sp. TF02-6]|uniref:HNH endonuclease signature motif containing protein n=1 Tax=Geodermatophilus sp. TF02-6 TaxID=2250575 RepID=UPI000DEB97AA|nr:HNH endonuclease signature motif containing protein [Geodermatophilus sp. TF02-6]RBY80820.1 endonuclease [Geodermatophilus sp. TF02-6]
MGELSSGLDALVTDDLHALGDGELLERTAELVRLRNRIDAELARTVRAADTRQSCEHDGLKTMPSWLRGHAHLSPAEAGRVVRAGRAIEHLPALAAAFAAGAVTADQVAVVAPVVTPENLERAAGQQVELAEVDAALTTVAATQLYRTLGQAVHHYLAGLDPDGPEPDPTEGRRLTIAKHADGSISFRGDLDAVGGEKLQAALESLVQAGRCAGDERTRSQQQGDALVQLGDLALAAGTLPILRGHKPQVIVTIGIEDLADPNVGSGAGEMGFGAVISAARARWLASDGQVTRIVMGPEGMPLDHGRSMRLFPPHVRRAAEVRDGGCVFTGCGAPTWWCDVHHLLEWALGGETDLDNAALLCERHHTKVHHGFRVERQPDGRWRTWRPDGTEIRSGPEHLAAA